MLTNIQRAKYFKLAMSAYRNVGPSIPFDDWRRDQHVALKLPPSTKQLDHVWGYESIMLRFAILADDAGQMAYFGDCAKRRLEWIFGGFARDLDYLQRRTVATSEAAYLQGMMDQSKLDGSDAESMRKLCAMVDSRIRALAKAAGVALAELPTAGRPWCFRGAKAASFAAFLDRSAA